MFCPGCGAENTTDQKFCRNCGMNLSDTIASFLHQFPQGDGVNDQRKEQVLEKFGQVAFSGFALVVFAGVGVVVYLIVTKMILERGNVGSGLLLLAFVVFAALSLAYVFLRESVDKQKQKVNPQLAQYKDPVTAAPDRASLSDGGFQPAESVIEDTTDLLPVESKTRKLQ